MKLIDADKISKLGLTIAISERTGDVLKGHARGKEEVIRRAVEVFIQAIDQAHTVDKWYYPSKGEYPKKNEWVLVIAKEDSYILPPGKWVMQYFDKSENVLRSNKYFANTTNSIYASKVKCWQYIEPPKEEE